MELHINDRIYDLTPIDCNKFKVLVLPQNPNPDFEFVHYPYEPLTFQHRTFNSILIENKFYAYNLRKSNDKNKS